MNDTSELLREHKHCCETIHYAMTRGQDALAVKVLRDELAQARAEERERIADEFGDFRMIIKGWLGIIKYGRTLRFFLLPHTKHKKGDDETN